MTTVSAGICPNILPSISVWLAITTSLSILGAVNLASTALVRTWASIMRTSLINWAVSQIACLSLILPQCHGVFYTPYQHLPSASFKSFNGTFGFPSGETQIFDEGTPMTIRWSTDFAAVNLYVVYNASSIPPSAGLQKQLSSKHQRHSRMISRPKSSLTDLDQLGTQTRRSTGP